MAELQNTIEIEFKPKGDTALLSAIKRLDKATKGLVNAQGSIIKSNAKVGKGATDITTKNRLLNNSFATLRSKLLLFNFAMAMGIRQITKFAKEASKVQSMERAFNTLSGGVEGSSKALRSLKVATNNTMSEFDLFQQANNAMILGVSKNSDEMAEMFDMAQRLGNALGKDTKESVESLITGIGRQSRLMLDNIGIMIKAEDAYKSYADKLKKSVESLTDAEKKQAFLNATINSAKEAVAGLGIETENSQMEFDRLTASIDDATASIGKGLQDSIIPMVEILTVFADKITPERVEAYATVIKGGLVVAMGLYVKKLKMAVLWQTRTGWLALASAVGILAGELLVMSGIFDGSSKNIDNAQAQAHNYVKALMGMKKEDLVKELEAQEGALSNVVDVTELYANKISDATNMVNMSRTMIGGSSKATRDYEQALTMLNMQWTAIVQSGALESINNQYEKNNSEITKNIEKIKLYLSVLDGGFSSMDSYNNAISESNALYLKTPESQRAVIDSQIAMIESLILVEGETKELIATLTMLQDKFKSLEEVEWLDKYSERLKTVDIGFQAIQQTAQAYWDTQQIGWDREVENLHNSDSFKKASTEKQAKLDKQLADKQRQAKQKAFKQQQALKIAQIGMDTASSVMSIWSEVPKFDFGISATALTAFVVGMGAIQAGMVASQAVPAFAKGGDFITNKPEMIMVGEAGREHVKITPIDRPESRALKDGGLTINVSAPLVDETILDTIIPAIEKAHRMNLA
jgi:hypothetical protein